MVITYIKRIVIFVFDRLLIFIVYINIHNAVESFIHCQDKAHLAMAFYFLTAQSNLLYSCMVY